MKNPPSRKFKSNGKTNSQINENNSELKEIQVKNLGNDDVLPDFYNENRIQNIISDDHDVDNDDYNNEIKADTSHYNITNNTNSIITHNKQQSKFLSTNKDKLRSYNQLSKLQQSEVNYEKVQINIEQIVQEDDKLNKLVENKEYEILSEVYI